MIFRKLGNPTSLSSVELLGLPEILEVLMICPDFDVDGGTCEVVSPFFEGEHDGEEFFVVDLIVAFCHHEGFGHEGYWSPFAILLLAEDRANGSITGVGFYLESSFFCWNGEYDVLSHLLLQLLEHLILGSSPCPFCIAGELGEQVNDLGVVPDELLVKVCESEE